MSGRTDSLPLFGRQRSLDAVDAFRRGAFRLRLSRGNTDEVSLLLDLAAWAQCIWNPLAAAMMITIRAMKIRQPHPLLPS